MDELERENEAKSYWGRKMSELEAENKAKKAARSKKKDDDEDDIAPVRTTSSSSSYWDKKTSELDSGIKTKTTVNEEPEDLKWYQKGLFSDGYDFGDVTKSILGIDNQKQKTIRTFEDVTPTMTIDELQAKRASASGVGEELELTKQYNEKMLAHYSDVFSKTQMDGQNHTVLEEIEILANMDSGDEKDKRKKAVLKKMEEMGMDSTFYAHFAGDGEFNFKTFGKWLGSAALAGIGAFDKSLADTADVLLGNPLKALGWENNPFSKGAEYFGNLYDTHRYNANLYAEKLGGGAWNFGSDFVEGTTGSLPSALLAFGTAGQSLTPTAQSLATQAFSRAGNFLTKAGLTVESMMKNPQFWMSYARTFGSDYKEAKEMGASDLAATVGSILTSFVNAGIEIGPAGDSGIQGLPDAVKKGGKPLLEWVESSIEEGGEEMLQKFVSDVVAKVVYGSDEELLDPIEYAKEGAIGMLSGMAVGGGQIGLQSAQNAVIGHQANKLSENEQAVLDKEIENRIAEAEEDGKKLTAKEKAKIKEKARSDLEKGYISTDLIEEVIGGETYTEYKDNITNEETLQKEFEELGNVKVTEQTVAQQARYKELSEQIQSIKDSDTRNQLKAKLDEFVAEQVKGSRLAESYSEIERGRQRFTADLSKYGKKYRSTIQAAIDSGVMNNTNRSHEFVDFVAKLSADTGESFDFTNNAKLKESGFALDGGKMPNGFRTKDGITLNMSSNESRRFVVGHEVTHVLEGTDLYEELQTAVFDYAKEKGEYDSRLESITALYKKYAPDSDPMQELTADLVGEYIFSDTDFINNLSVKNQNVFQKIYSEIKHLLKLATAGSKEARMLEQARRTFEKAYRQAANTQTDADADVKYSLRKEAPPTKTQKAYKLMRLQDGKLYPLFIGNNEEIAVDTWYNADSPNLSQLKDLEPGTHLVDMETGEAMTWDEYAEQHLPKKNGKPARSKPNKDDIHWANDNGYRFMHIEDKAGGKSEGTMLKQYGDTRAYYNWGVNGSSKSKTGEGSASLYALRPGWHFGELPTMHQIGYGGKTEDTFRLDNQVWTEVEMAADVDYNAEAEANWGGDIPTHIPENGYYKFATNPTQKKTKGGDTANDATKGDWYVAGAFKVNRILSDAEADAVVEQYNKDTGKNIPLDYRRKDGRRFNAETMSVESGDDVQALPGGSVTKYSLSTWTPETQKKVSDNLVSAGFHKEDVDKWIKDTNSVAAVIAADKSRLDFEAADNQVMLKDNQEYIKTLDASTLCAKRLVYQGTFDAIQHRLPDTMLSSDDLIDLLNMMKEHNVQTPCGVCYVESRRRHLGKFAQQWLDGYEGEYKPRLDEVTTSDGLEALRKSHPEAYKDFTDAMNKKGSSNPKVVQLRTEYRNDIMNLTPAQIRKIEAIGGLRVQSFSDFETPHLLDMMQAVMDMSAKGLHSQAYTKVPNFAWVFGDTGIKINLSLIAEGDGFDSNGNLAFSSVEGMDINEAMRLRDAYSQNVGTIIVGANDKHILACMADDRIDFIIPFHRSGWGMKELEMMGMNSYTDYTYGQKEHDLNKPTKVVNGVQQYAGLENLYPPDYWNYELSGKENAERYLNLCAKLGREPKFAQFLVDNGDGSYSLQPDGSTDGYWKTLIDFKMYDNDGIGAAQQKVVPNFNMEEAYRVLNEYEGGANKLPVANDVVEEFVAKYKGDAPVKYSLSDSDGNQLTPEQQEFFKDSVVRDENGSLKVMYHGTSKGGFTTFDTYGSNYGLFGTGSYFTDSKNIGESYTKKGKGKSPQVYEAYLNIKNPMDMDAAADPAEWAKAFPDADFPASGTNEQFYRAVEEFYADQYMPKWEVAEEIQATLESGMGYDGITHIGGGRVNADGERHRVYIAFQPEQIKNMDNIKPTNDPDIRYSLSEDNKVPYSTVLQNLSSYELSDLRRIADQLSNEEVTISKNMSRNSLEFVLKRTIESYAKDDPSLGFYLPSVKAKPNAEVVVPSAEVIEQETDQSEDVGFIDDDAPLPWDDDVQENVIPNYRPSNEEIKSAFEDMLSFMHDTFGHKHTTLEGYVKESGVDGVVEEMIADWATEYSSKDPIHKMIDSIDAELKSTLGDDYERNIDEDLLERVKGIVSEVLVDTKSSETDNEGNQLNLAQSEFFKDSKIRDRDGNLRRVYHTTQNDFTVFDKSRKGEATDGPNTFLGFFFAESPDHMEQFPEFQGGKTDAYYLDMKQPMDLTNISKEAFMDIVELTGGDRMEAAEAYDEELEAEKARARFRGDNNTTLSVRQLLYNMVGDYYHADFFDALKPNYDKLVAKGYDGVIDYLDEMTGEREFVVFESNQAKLASNTNPTSDPDIRYSLTEGNTTAKDPLSELQLNEDIAPTISETETVAENATVEAPLPGDADAPPLKIETVADRIQQKIINAQTELVNIRQAREQAIADYDEDINQARSLLESRKNQDTKLAQNLRRRIERLTRLKADITADHDKRISDLEKRIEKLHSQEYNRAEHRREMESNYTKMWENLLGDTSTWKDMSLGLQYKTKTLRRILRNVVRDGSGNRDIQRADAIYDELETKYDHNEAQLKVESGKLKESFRKMNLTHEEDTYAQMLGELRHNPETELTEDMVKEYYNKHKRKIDSAKVDKAIAETRKLYDDLIVRVNDVLRKQGMREIPYRQGYFPHFTNPKQGWLAKLLNWKTIDTEIPTSIAGLTQDFKPQRSWQSFSQTRRGDSTDYSLYQGLDTYIHGALDWIYHIEDIQKRRALENYIRFTHSDEGIQARIKEIKKLDYDADETQDMIDAVLKEAHNPLSGFVRELMNRTNTLANKKSSMDREMEDFINRKAYSTMTNLNNRVTANMVVGSLSSAMTNFIPMVQSWHQVSPVYTVRGLGDMIRSIVRDDGMIAKSDFLTNRLRQEENLYKTGWDKVSDKAAVMMDVVDNITAQTVWRSKYLQNLHEGMSEARSIRDADQFAKNLMGGRSRGNAPSIFDAKNPVMKIFTAFQLEVANQYGYMFEDVPQDTPNKARLVKGYATAFLGAYLYNSLYSSLAGRDAAFDPIGIIEDLLKDLFDDDEEPEDIILGFGKEVLEEVPFVGGLLGGGRIPMTSAIPYANDTTPFESMLNDLSNGDLKSMGKEMLKPLYYLAMPVAGGQVKKTVEGLSMFSDDHPIAGSYTDSGALRYPVDDTLGSRAQAALFGQYANSNARDYFDNDYAPLKEKQTQEFIDSGMTIQEYRMYRDGLKDLSKQADKVNYINSLDLTDAQKSVLKSYLYDEEGYKEENPEKYAFLEKEGIGYIGYKQLDEDTQSAWSWAFNHQDEYRHYKENGVMPGDYSTYYIPMLDFADEGNEAYQWAYDNPEKATFGKVFGEGVTEYRRYVADLDDIKADKDENGKSISGSRKEKVLDYINGLDIDYGAKLILFKNEYNSDDESNQEIIDYLNSRSDISFEEEVSILRELGFTVTEDGTIYWD